MVIQVDAGVAERQSQTLIYLPEGVFRINEKVTLEAPVSLIGGLDFWATTSIGAITYSWSKISSTVATIGRYCSIASGVELRAQKHETLGLSASSFACDAGLIWADFTASRSHEFHPESIPAAAKHGGFVIGNDVWIGANAYIRGGVVIGDGAVIGPNAMVTEDVPPYAIVVGNPGLVVKFRFRPDITESLLRILWWRFACLDFDFETTQVQGSIVHLTDMITMGEIDPYSPRNDLMYDRDVPRVVHPLFDAERYLALNSDVVERQVDPVAHHLNYGWKEARPI